MRTEPKLQQLSVPVGPKEQRIGITDIYTPEEIEAYSVKFHASVITELTRAKVAFQLATICAILQEQSK